MYMLNPSPTQGKSLFVWMILGLRKGIRGEMITLSRMVINLLNFFDKKNTYMAERSRSHIGICSFGCRDVNPLILLITIDGYTYFRISAIQSAQSKLNIKQYAQCEKQVFLGTSSQNIEQKLWWTKMFIEQVNCSSKRRTF